MRFLNPLFSFYREWYWWVLFLIGLVSAYIQWAAYHFEKEAKLLRFQFGYLYILPGIFSLAALILMLTFCGWVSVIVTACVMLLFYLLLRSTIHYHAIAFVGLFMRGGSD